MVKRKMIVKAESVGINMAFISSFDFSEGIISCMKRYISKMPEPKMLPVPIMNIVEDNMLDNILVYFIFPPFIPL